MRESVLVPEGTPASITEEQLWAERYRQSFDPFFQAWRQFNKPDISSQQLPERPQAILATDLPHEKLTQKRFNKFLGSVALGQEVQVAQKPKSLIDALHGASEGNAEDIEMLGLNILTAACEMSFKTDYISEVTMHFNEDGSLTQYGHDVVDIQRNSLRRPNRKPELQELTKIEALNATGRIPDLARSGWLDTHWYIVPSHIPHAHASDPNALTEKDLGSEGDGFFVHHMTSAMQGVTVVNGEIKMQSGFQAGVINGYEKQFTERMTARYDFAVTRRVYEHLGLTPPETAHEALNGHLISKDLLPNGIADYMKLRDRFAQELTNEVLLRDDSFYNSLSQASRQKEESLGDVCASIKTELMQRYKTGELKDEFKAVQVLWDIVFDHVTSAAVENTNIQADAWGSVEAALRITEARRLMDAGDMMGAMHIQQQFKQIAVGTGCGGGGRTKQNGTAGNESSASESTKAGGGSSEGETDKEETANIPAVIRCIACDEKSPRKDVVKPNSWRCPHCKYEIDICDGRVINPPQIKKREQFTLVSAVTKALKESSKDQWSLAA